MQKSIAEAAISDEKKRCRFETKFKMERTLPYLLKVFIHFSISTAQKTILDTAKVSSNSYKVSGCVLKIPLKKGV